MRRYVKVILVGAANLVLLFGPAVSRAEYPLDEASKRLVYCIDVHAYAAHWKVFNQDPAAARAMARQFSRARTVDTDRIYQTRIDSKSIMFGKSLEELIEEMAAKQLRSLGL
jgi:hypothetical protein